MGMLGFFGKINNTSGTAIPSPPPLVVFQTENVKAFISNGMGWILLLNDKVTRLAVSNDAKVGH